MGTFPSKTDLPPAILANLAADEQILFVERVLEYPPKAVKWVYLALGLIAAGAFSLMTLQVLMLFEPINILLLLMMLAIVVMILLIGKKSSAPKTVQVIVTGQRIFERVQGSRPLRDDIQSIRVKDLKAICVRDQKILPSGIITGTLDFFAEQVGAIQRYKLSLPNVEDLPPKLRVLESIAWHFGRDSAGGNADNVMVAFPLDPACAKKIMRNATTFVILLVVGGVMAIIGGIMLPFAFNVPIIHGMPVPPEVVTGRAVSTILFAFGIAIFFVTFPTLGGGLKKILGFPQVTDLRIEEEELRFWGSNNPARISLRDFDHMDVIQPRSSNAGAVRFFTRLSPDPVVVFGPVANYCETLGHIYSAILAWKACHGQLHSPEQLMLQSVAKENALDAAVEIPRNRTASVEAKPLPPPHLTEDVHPAEVPIDDMPLLANYLDPSEHVLFTHKPVVTKSDLRIATLLSIIGIVGLPLLPIILINPTLLNILGPLYGGIAAGYILLAIVAWCGWCSLANLRLEKKMVYLFTSQKMIIHTPKRVILVGYDNMTFLLRRDSRHTYRIEITLANPIEKHSTKFSYLDRTTFIFAVPKTNDLFDRLKNLKDQFVASKK